MPNKKMPTNTNRLEQAVANAQRNRAQREQGYREQALKLYPWVCGRCGREFTRGNLQMLTVHHRDHDHDNNPPDGSNWELLCLYCHDNEHARYVDNVVGGGGSPVVDEHASPSTYRAFADLKDLLKGKE